MNSFGCYVLLLIRCCITIPLIWLAAKALTGSVQLNMVVEKWYVVLNERSQ